MNLIIKFLVSTLGASWRTTLCSIGEAIAIQALTYTLNTEYHDPRVFWSGLGLSVMAVIRGWFSKDRDVTNSLHPGPARDTATGGLEPPLTATAAVVQTIEGAVVVEPPTPPASHKF